MPLECISDQQLQDLVEECLSQQEHTQVLEHAARCVACQDLLADLYSSRSMDGAAAELAQTRPQEAPPHMVDEFRVLQRLGRGGMGVVYLAEDTLLRRPVAIKFLHEELPNLEGRSLDEARAIARLNHPNVLAIYSIGNHRGRPYLVSEYVKGRSLASIARPRPLPEALEIIRALSRGLAAAHAQGVLHRDIKPANVIITGPGEVKLIDFGLASLMGEAITASGRSTDQARPMEVAGTPLYMAPELWRGQPATVSSDIYALGAVLFELCAGHPPHRGSSAEKLSERVLHHDAPLLRRISPTVPPHISAAVARCLHRDPAERFPSVAAFLSALAPPQRPRQLTASLLLLLAAMAILGPMIITRIGLTKGASPRPGMVRIQGGTYAQGWSRAQAYAAYQACEATKEQEGARCSPDLYERATPSRGVKVSSFDIDQVETTCLDFANWISGQGLFPQLESVADLGDARLPVIRDKDGRKLAVIDEDSCLRWRNGRLEPKDGQQRHPVTFVTHEGAVRYCRGRHKRLPTEAEWEYAATSGGKNTEPYPWGAQRPQCAQVLFGTGERRPCAEPVKERLRAVGSSPLDRTPEGVHDLGGSIAEWVQDIFVDRYPDCAGLCHDPLEEARAGLCLPQGQYVYRGGDYLVELLPSRYRRRGLGEETIGMGIGFRCAASIDP